MNTKTNERFAETDRRIRKAFTMEMRDLLFPPGATRHDWATDAAGVATALADTVDGWLLAGSLDAGPRGSDAAALAQRLAGTVAAGGTRHADVADALAAALAQAAPDGRVLAFGSFHAASEALRHLNASD